MRIGVIAPAWLPVPPPAYGGTEAVVDRLARGLVAAGHDVLLAAPDDSTCPVPLVPGTSSPSAPLRSVEALRQELGHVVRAYAAMDDVDVVHDHTLAGPLSSRHPLGVQVVTTNHGTFGGEFGELYRGLDRELGLVAISHHQASTAVGTRVDAVIHHGIDVERIPPGAGDGGYVCFLGRMSPDKGAREAIVTARRAGLRLILAAKMREPEERAYFEARVAPLLGADAEYVGELGEAEKYELLGGAAALVNPIQWPEPFGLVMVEALAAGTPVVAAGAGSVPEIVDDGVTGFVRDDLTGLSEALAAAGTLDRAACRTAAASRFSTGRMVADHLDLYQRLLDLPPARPQRHLRAVEGLSRPPGAPASASPAVEAHRRTSRGHGVAAAGVQARPDDEE